MNDYKYPYIFVDTGNTDLCAFNIETKELSRISRHNALGYLNSISRSSVFKVTTDGKNIYFQGKLVYAGKLGSYAININSTKDYLCVGYPGLQDIRFVNTKDGTIKDIEGTLVSSSKNSNKILYIKEKVQGAVVYYPNKQYRKFVLDLDSMEETEVFPGAETIF